MGSAMDHLADLAVDAISFELRAADASSFLHETYEGRRSQGFGRQIALSFDDTH